MFGPQHARQEFATMLRGSGLQEDNLNLTDGCEAVINFYRHQRPNGRVFGQHEDANMLPFQWGIYDWAHFEIAHARERRVLKGLSIKGDSRLSERQPEAKPTDGRPSSGLAG